MPNEDAITIRTKVGERYTISSILRERLTAVDPASTWYTKVWENRKDSSGKLKPKYIYGEKIESGDANIVIRKHKEIQKKILQGILEGMG